MKRFICLLVCLTVFALTLSANAAYTLINWGWSQGSGATITGFKVKCGRSSGSYTLTTIVSDPAARSLNVYTATNGRGQWFCTVSAFNATSESTNGNEVQFVLPAPPMVIFPGP